MGQFRPTFSARCWLSISVWVALLYTHCRRRTHHAQAVDGEYLTELALALRLHVRKGKERTMEMYEGTSKVPCCFRAPSRMARFICSVIARAQPRFVRKCRALAVSLFGPNNGLLLSLYRRRAARCPPPRSSPASTRSSHYSSSCTCSGAYSLARSSSAPSLSPSPSTLTGYTG